MGTGKRKFEIVKLTCRMVRRPDEQVEASSLSWPDEGGAIANEMVSEVSATAMFLVLLPVRHMYGVV